MYRRSRHLWLVGCALALAALPARAANPKLNLKLENVAPAEAIQKLSDAAGVPLSIYGNGAQANTGPREIKQSFDWQGVTFAKALRQLCDKFMFQLNRGPSGYTLYPSFQAPPGAPLKRVGAFEKNGVKMYVRSASVNDYRRSDFIGGNNNGTGSLSLELAAELGEGDGELIAGITNVSGRDDMGNVLQFDNLPNFNGGGYNGATYPDEWLGNINLPAPHPKAKKLQWVEGDVMAYRSLKPFRVEIPVPLTGNYTRKDVGDLVIVASRFKVAGNEGGDDDAVEGLPNQPFRAQGGGASVRVRLYSPQAGSRVGSRQGQGVWNIQPYLVGTNGKVYASNRTQSSGWGDPQFQVNDSTYTFPPTEDAPVKLVWDLVERSEPVKLFSFKLTDIPLPDPNVPGIPKRGTPGVIKPGPGTNHPFYEKDGGILINRVQVGDKAAEGTLQIGLAARAGADWGPTRWLELDLDEGAAKLEGVKPGSYRIQRMFKPKEGGEDPKGGAWLNKDVVITVVAGKEVPLAPLKWSLQVPTAKPPVKAATIKRPGK